MATLYNNAAGGVLNGAVTPGNSGGGSGTAWNSVDVTGTASLTYSGTASHGSLGYGFVSQAGNRVSFGWDAGSVVPSKSMSLRSYLRLASLPSSEAQIAIPWNITQTVAAVNVSTSGKLKVLNRIGTPIFTAAAAMSLDTWYRFEIGLEVGTSGTNGVVRFSYFLGDSTTAIESFTSTTADLGTDNILAWYLGKLSNSGDWSGFMDSIELDMASGLLMGPYIAASSVLRPTSTVSNPGNWVNVGGASSLSAAQADESDVTLAQTPASPANAQITFGLAGRLATGTPTVKVRLSASAATPNTYADVALMQGTTVVATRNFGPLTTTPTDYSYTLTTTEAGNITDRGDLRIRVTGNQP